MTNAPPEDDQQDQGDSEGSGDDDNQAQDEGYDSEINRRSNDPDRTS